MLPSINATVGLLSAVNLSAGIASANLSAITFSNSNGVSFGLTNGVVTATVQTNYLTTARASNDAVGLNTAQTNVTWTVNSAGLSLNAAGYAGTGVTTAGAGSIGLSGTLGNGGLSLSASIPAFLTTAMLSNAVTLSNINVSAGTTSNNLSAFTFSNGSGVSFGLNGSVITASVAVAGGAQTAISGIVVSDATYTSGTVSFSNQANVTIGSSVDGATQYIRLSGNAAQTVQTQSLIAAVYDGVNSISTGTIRFTNANGVSFSVNGQTVSGSVAAGATATGNFGAIAAGTQTATSGTMVFSDSNGISFGMSGSSRITASYTVPTQTNQSAIRGLGVSNTGQTAGNTGLSTGIDWVLAGSQSITLSQSTAGGGPNTIWMQHPAWLTTAMQSNAATISNVNVSAGTTSNNLSAMVFSNSNNLSFGLNGSTITGSYTVPTVTNSSMSVSDAATSGTLARLAFTNLNGVTLSLSTGAGGSHTIVGSHNALTSQSNQAFSAAGGSSAFQTIGFSDNAYGSFTNTNGSVAIASIRASIYAVSNTTQSTSNTYNLSALSFAGHGIASVGVSNGSVIVSVPAGAPSPVNFSAGTTSGDLGSVVFSNSNGVSFGLNGSTITASVVAGGGGPISLYALGNTTQNSSTTLNSLSFNAIGAATWGYSNGSIQVSIPATSSLVGLNGMSISTNGSTISLFEPCVSSYENIGVIPAGSAMTWGGTSISHAIGFMLPYPISASFLRMPVLMTTNSTTIATLASATATAQGGISSTVNAVVYSIGTGASSRSLQSVASGSASFAMSQRISVSNSTQGSYTLAVSQMAEGIQTTLSTQYSVSNTNYSFTTNQIATNFSSVRYLDIPFANSLTPGAYWLIVGLSTSSSSAGAAGLAALTNCNVRYSNHFGVSQHNVAPGVMGSTNVASGGHYGAGSFSTAGGGTTAALPISAISSLASNVRGYFQLLRSA